MTKRDIAAVLEEIAFLLELKGENPFKVKAYATGARVIESLPEEPAVLVQKGILRNVKGIGQTLEGTVTELVTTGRSTVYEELKAAFPASLLDMATIPGLGPKKLKAIYDQLGISTVGELEYACIENRLVGLQGFGQKTQEKILAGIRQYKRRQGFHLYANVIEEAEGKQKKLSMPLQVSRISRRSCARAMVRSNWLRAGVCRCCSSRDRSRGSSTRTPSTATARQRWSRWWRRRDRSGIATSASLTTASRPSTRTA